MDEKLLLFFKLCKNNNKKLKHAKVYNTYEECILIKGGNNVLYEKKCDTCSKGGLCGCDKIKGGECPCKKKNYEDNLMILYDY